MSHYPLSIVPIDTPKPRQAFQVRELVAQSTTAGKGIL